MRSTSTAIDPVRKRRVVPIPPDQAFALFTTGLPTWWPVRTHSIAEREDVGVRVDGRIGGHIVEVAPDGSECSWADIIGWDPPHRVVLAWHPHPDPVTSTIVEVRFTAVDGGTQVDLEHRAFEELGDERGPEARAGYHEGWEPVLDDYVAAAT